MMRDDTKFERRKRRIKIPRRDLVQFRCGPDLAERLVVLEQTIKSEVSTVDPLCATFLEWYADEWKKYGVQIREGLAAFYWQHGSHGLRTFELSREGYEEARDEFADSIRPQVLDDEHFTGRYLIQEFVWWSAGDWIMQTHLIEAIDHFREFWALGKMKEWQRRKRRRMAAARRKMIKALYFTPIKRERPLNERPFRDDDDEDEDDEFDLVA